jgi:hypothetical protein
MATLTIAKQNLLFAALKQFDLLRKSPLNAGGFSFEKATQPAVFALS